MNIMNIINSYIIFNNIRVYQIKTYFVSFDAPFGHSGSHMCAQPSDKMIKTKKKQKPTHQNTKPKQTTNII